MDQCTYYVDPIKSDLFKITYFSDVIQRLVLR